MFKYSNYNQMELTDILAVYKGNESHSIEHYIIENKTIGAAKPLSIDTANSLFENLQYVKGGHIEFKGIIPEHILYTNTTNQQIVWKCKSHKRKLLFKNESFKSQEYMLPNLVFELKGSVLSVFATKTYQVKPTSKLYHAPFLNVWYDGRVCMGSATINKTNVAYYQELVVKAEQHFFNSYFTHTNHDVIVDGNLIEVYKELNKAKKFPNNILLPSGTKNLNSLCQ